MPFKIHKPSVLSNIAKEENFRKTVEGYIAQIAQTLLYNELAKLVPDEKRFGSSGRKYKLLGETEKGYLVRNLEDFTKKRKYSIWKEKTYRYVYNNDLPNLIKYHEKMTAYEREEIDRVSEMIEKGECIEGINLTNGIENGRDKGEETYRLLCERYKNRYEIGKEMVEKLATNA